MPAVVIPVCWVVIFILLTGKWWGVQFYANKCKTYHHTFPRVFPRWRDYLLVVHRRSVPHQGSHHSSGGSSKVKVAAPKNGSKSAGKSQLQHQQQRGSNVSPPPPAGHSQRTRQPQQQQQQQLSGIQISLPQAGLVAHHTGTMHAMHGGGAGGGGSGRTPPRQGRQHAPQHQQQSSSGRGGALNWGRDRA